MLLEKLTFSHPRAESWLAEANLNNLFPWSSLIYLGKGMWCIYGQWSEASWLGLLEKLFLFLKRDTSQGKILLHFPAFFLLSKGWICCFWVVIIRRVVSMLRLAEQNSGKDLSPQRCYWVAEVKDPEITLSAVLILRTNVSECSTRCNFYIICTSLLFLMITKRCGTIDIFTIVWFSGCT